METLLCLTQRIRQPTGRLIRLRSKTRYPTDLPTRVPKRILDNVRTQQALVQRRRHIQRVQRDQFLARFVKTRQ